MIVGKSDSGGGDDEIAGSIEKLDNNTEGDVIVKTTSRLIISRNLGSLFIYTLPSLLYMECKGNLLTFRPTFSPH